MAGALRLDAPAVTGDGDMRGRILDTFVTARLRAEATVAACRTRLCHLRQEQGRHEIDVIAEVAGGGVVAIEVKAGAAPREAAAAHLVGLRDRLGSPFVAGVLLHIGPRVYALDDRVVAGPVLTVWR
jgi:predicted RecB family endonuclease